MSNLEEVDLYLKSFQDYIQGLYAEDTDMLNEYGIVDVEDFVNVLMDELQPHAVDNFHEFGRATLSEKQYLESFKLAVTQYHLNGLIDKGLIHSYFDEETGEITYKLSELGDDLTKNI